MGNHNAYVVMCGDKFCRFDSGSVYLKQNPLAATLYMREADANKRISRTHWVNGREKTSPGLFRVVKIKAIWEVQT